MKAIRRIESLLFSTILIANIKEAQFKEISWVGCSIQFCCINIKSRSEFDG